MRCARRASGHKGFFALALFDNKRPPDFENSTGGDQVGRDADVGRAGESGTYSSPVESGAGQDPKPNSGLLILQHRADVGRGNVAAIDGYDGGYVKSDGTFLSGGHWLQCSARSHSGFGCE